MRSNYSLTRSLSFAVIPDACPRLDRGSKRSMGSRSFAFSSVHKTTTLDSRMIGNDGGKGGDDEFGCRDYFHTKAVPFLNLNMGNSVFITNPLHTI